jgi:hypothetical protein
MKRLQVVLIFATTVMLAGCGPVATFDEPQPQGIKPLGAFPERLQGHYRAEDGASVLSVSERFITRHYDFDLREHRNSFGISFHLAGDTLINLEDGTKEIVVLDGDTVVSRVAWIDTLFIISTDNVLKRFKGYCFLNILYRENEWTVKKLSLTKGVLTFGSLSSPEDVKKLRAITESTTDTVSTYFSPSRKQFRQFVRQEGFGEEELFYRIVKPRQ